MLSVTYDVAELCQAARFKNAMIEVFDSAKDRLGAGTRFAEELRALQVLLMQRLESYER